MASDAGPTLSFSYRAAEACDELVGHRRVHVEPVGRGAGLPAAAELRDHRALDRRGDVGVGGDDERRVAAEFHAGVDTRSAACLSSMRPTPVDPVKETLRTRSSASQVLTTPSRRWS